MIRCVMWNPERELYSSWIVDETTKNSQLSWRCITSYSNWSRNRHPSRALLLELISEFQYKEQGFLAALVARVWKMKRQCGCVRILIQFNSRPSHLEDIRSTLRRCRDDLGCLNLSEAPTVHWKILIDYIFQCEMKLNHSERDLRTDISQMKHKWARAWT